MTKSLIQKISEKGKKRIAIGLTIGILGGASVLSGCAGQNIRTEPVSDPYGNVKLTELGKQYQEKYGFKMFTASGLAKKRIYPLKGNEFYHPRETIYIIGENAMSLSGELVTNLTCLTTKEKFSPVKRKRRVSSRLFKRDLAITFDATQLYNYGKKLGYDTTEWEDRWEICNKETCDSLGSIYFSVTDKK